MVAPKYVQRMARLPRVLELLADHPDGLTLAELAERVDVPVAELHEDLLAFYTADVDPLMLGLSRPEVLEFLGPDGEADPTEAERVRIVDDRPAQSIGVEQVDAAELALVYTAALALLDVDPDDADLAAAVDVLTEAVIGDAPDETPSPTTDASTVDTLRTAAAGHHCVRIVYSRSWHQGVSERVIEPYRIVRTRRGWEVDAGPLDEQGQMRSYLVPNIRTCELLDETFLAPADLDRRLADQRETARVRVRLPHSARWAADFYAEQVTLDLDLLPPLDHRIGLLLLAAGPDATVVDPARLVLAGPALAAELLEHHRAE
jgi:predicted DNA-binding transcriptional regulator YafY